MSIKIKKQITLNNEELKQIIKEGLEKNGMKMIELTYQVNIGRELKGYGSNEHYETVFNGISFEIK